MIEGAWRRIGLSRPAVADGAALVAAHRSFALSVPSEDYDIHLGVPIRFTVPDLVDKIVQRGRGGYCYELNGLFCALLRHARFEVTAVSAFTLDDGGRRGPDLDHMRLLVRGVDGVWIADVGTGGRWLEPVPLEPGRHGTVRVENDGDLWWTDELSGAGVWERSWAWTSHARRLDDFVPRSRYHEHAPDSHFRAHRFAVLPTKRGRLSLDNGRLSEVVDGRRRERDLGPDEEEAVLAERFGVRIEGLAKRLVLQRADDREASQHA